MWHVRERSERKHVEGAIQRTSSIQLDDFRRTKLVELCSYLQEARAPEQLYKREGLLESLLLPLLEGAVLANFSHHDH